MRSREEQIRRGRKLARSLPQPRIVQEKGVNVVTQEVDGLSAEELLWLSEYYCDRYGDRGRPD